MADMDRRLICDECGESASVVESDGGFTVECTGRGGYGFTFKSICCATQREETAEAAIEKWVKLHGE